MVTRRGEATRSRIIESGLDLLLTEGSASLSLRQVAGAAGITPMAIYRHFDDKDTLELALLERAFAVFESYLLEARSSGTPGQRLTALAAQFFSFALEREAHFRFLFLSDARPTAGPRGSEVRGLSRPTFLILREALERWQAEPAIDNEALNSLTIDVLAFCIGQVSLVLSGNLAYPRRERKKHLERAFERFIDQAGAR